MIDEEKDALAQVENTTILINVLENHCRIDFGIF